MDWIKIRPRIKSPDGKFEITVTGPKESLRAWVTVKSLTPPYLSLRVLSIQRDVTVLWRPDSKAFALTDDRYANLSYARVYGVYFAKCTNIGTCLALRVTDLTPVVRKVFEASLQKYYFPNPYEILLFYAKILRWIRKDRLLVGVSAMVTNPRHISGENEWNMAYIVDVAHKSVLREIKESQLLSKYGIKIAR